MGPARQEQRPGRSIERELVTVTCANGRLVYMKLNAADIAKRRVSLPCLKLSRGV